MQSVKRTGAQQFEQRTCQTLSTPPHRADASDPLALGRPAFPLSGGSPAALPPYPQTKDPPHFFISRRTQDTEHQVPLSTKTRVLMRKARRADVRGAGLWPTGVREPLENAANAVPQPL